MFFDAKNEQYNNTIKNLYLNKEGKGSNCGRYKQTLSVVILSSIIKVYLVVLLIEHNFLYAALDFKLKLYKF